MDLIPNYITPGVTLVLVFIAAMLAQRKWGSKALWWVWIASEQLGLQVQFESWIFYKYGFPSEEEFFQHLFGIAFLVTYLFQAQSLLPQVR